MQKARNLFPAILLIATPLGVAACGGGHDTYTNPAGGAASTTATAPDTMPGKHHSKLAGAAAGAVVGHMLGGHAVAGAAAGALIQHERNKHKGH